MLQEACSKAKSWKIVLGSGEFIESKILTLNANIKSRLTTALSLPELKFWINS